MRSRWAIPTLILVILQCAGCERNQPLDAAANPTGDGALRIVSLSPAMSRMLMDLGLEDCIVGRSGFCSMLDPTLPVIGNLTEIDFEILVRSKPTHVFVQPPAGGIDPALSSLASDHGWVLVVRRLNTVSDIADMVEQGAEAISAFGGPSSAGVEQRAVELMGSIDRLRHSSSTMTWTGSTLLVIPGDPALAFGAGTYLDELLKAHGGVNAVQLQGWIEMSLEDVTRLNPAAIVSVRSKAGKDGLAAAGPLGLLDIDAVRRGRLAVLSHDEAQLPSTSVVEVAAELAEILRAWGGSSP